MDTKTTEAIDGIRGDVRQLETRLRDGIDILEVHVERGFEDTRRHFDVIAESLRDDVRVDTLKR